MALKTKSKWVAQKVPGPARLPYQFTVGQYHRMTEEGILTADDRVELLKGWVVGKMPRKPPHNGSLACVNRLLLQVLPKEWVLRVQSAVTFADSEPEPDFAIVKGPAQPISKDTQDSKTSRL